MFQGPCTFSNNAFFVKSTIFADSNEFKGPCTFLNTTLFTSGSNTFMGPCTFSNSATFAYSNTFTGPCVFSGPFTLSSTPQWDLSLTDSMSTLFAPRRTCLFHNSNPPLPGSIVSCTGSTIINSASRSIKFPVCIAASDGLIPFGIVQDEFIETDLLNLNINNDIVPTGYTLVSLQPHRGIGNVIVDSSVIKGDVITLSSTNPGIGTASSSASKAVTTDSVAISLNDATPDPTGSPYAIECIVLV